MHYSYFGTELFCDTLAPPMTGLAGVFLVQSGSASVWHSGIPGKEEMSRTRVEGNVYRTKFPQAVSLS